eukprot:TRINITY_DN4602_c0_g1_i1.p1 TRINITY_DN4602_c0_g1~~TRINITY_DN4602_c0_g1_i1.p1  ORF type:complete len:203 (-),score=35.13 TRINITY_DN4602_c0_g1_i1:110-718(-)
MKSRNSEAATSHNMTVEGSGAKYSKRILRLALKETLEEVKLGKRHYDTYHKVDLANPSETPSKVSRKKSFRTWTPSKSLIEYNRRQAMYCDGPQRIRKQILGKSASNSSIINMVAFESKPQASPKDTNSSRIQRLLTYKDGPKFRPERVAEKICKTDMELKIKSPEAAANRRQQRSEYMLNRSNSRSSRVFHSCVFIFAQMR